MIIEEPSEEDNEKRKYKYPFVASEILSALPEAVLSIIFEKEIILYYPKKEEHIVDDSSKEETSLEKDEETKNEYIEKEKTEELYEPIEETSCLADFLFSFLKPHNDLNQILSGYFSSFLSSLALSVKIDLFTYLKANRFILSQFIYHNTSKSISEAITKICLLENLSNEEGSGVKEFQLSIISMLIEQLSNADPIKSMQCCQTLLSLIESNQISSYFAIPEMLLKIIKHCISKKRKCAEFAYSILTSLLMKNPLKKILNPKSNISEDEEQYSEKCVKIMSQTINEIVKASIKIVSENNDSFQDMQLDSRMKIFGSFKFKVLEFIIESYKSNVLHERFFDAQFIRSLFQLFFEFPMNSNLHQLLSSFLIYFIENAGDDEINIISEANIINDIASSYDNNVFNYKNGKRFIHPYCGYLKKIANTINSKPQFSSLLENNIEWINYLEHINQNNAELESTPQSICQGESADYYMLDLDLNLISEKVQEYNSKKISSSIVDQDPLNNEEEINQESRNEARETVPESPGESSPTYLIEKDRTIDSNFADCEYWKMDSLSLEEALINYT